MAIKKKYMKELSSAEKPLENYQTGMKMIYNGLGGRMKIFLVKESSKQYGSKMWLCETADQEYGVERFHVTNISDYFPKGSDRYLILDEDSLSPYNEYKEELYEAINGCKKITDSSL